MNYIRIGLCALALAAASISSIPAYAQIAAQQTISQVGYFNGKRFTSVTYTVHSDGTLTITFHYEEGGQWTQTITNTAAFFQMWQQAREISGTDGND